MTFFYNIFFVSFVRLFLARKKSEEKIKLSFHRVVYGKKQYDPEKETK